MPNPRRTSAFGPVWKQRGGVGCLGRRPRQRVVEEKIKYLPWEGKQADWHLADATIKAAITGARAGKTISASADVADRLIRQPGYFQDDIDQGIPYTVAVGAPDYPMIRKVVMPMLLRMIPKGLHASRFHHTNHTLLTRGQKGLSLLYFLSAKNPESWQGQELYGVWLDEVALMKEVMFDEAQTRLSSRNGWMILTGTPRGPNWVKHRIFDYSLTEDGRREIYFTTWRTIDNPHYPREKLEQFRRTMPPKYFKRMFEASWDVFEGQVYDELNEHVHRVGRGRYTFVLPDGRRSVGQGPEEVRLELVVAGVDWGYSNPGAIVVVGLSDGDWYALDESHAAELLVDARGEDSWIRRALALQVRWEVETFFCDTENPEYIQQFRRAGVRAANAEKDVHPGIMCVARLFHVDPESGQPRLRILSDLEHLWGELVYYHWKTSQRTGMVGEDPEKVDDHCADALRYAIYTVTRRKRFKREPMYSMA